MQPVDLITISREYGAGGSALAAALGERLGWRVFDDDIAREVARRLGLAEDDLVEWDEHAPGVLESLGSVLVLGSPELLVDPDVLPRPDAEEVAAATRHLLLGAAQHPPLVIVGHGAQSLFHGRPGTLHLRLVAPVETRVQRICHRRPCNARDAVALARRLDADRAEYVRRFYGRDVRDPLLYDLMINTGRVAIDQAARLVVELMAEREHAST